MKATNYEVSITYFLRKLLRLQYSITLVLHLKYFTHRFIVL